MAIEPHLVVLEPEQLDPGILETWKPQFWSVAFPHVNSEIPIFHMLYWLPSLILQTCLLHVRTGAFVIYEQLDHDNSYY